MCEDNRTFRIDRDDNVIPNWRETLVCETCGLSNRLRASLHLARLLHVDAPPGTIYITEQLTPMFQWLQSRVSNLVGSEFVDPTLPSGSMVTIKEHPVRHEDLNRTSFADGACGIVLTFDVLEHIPNYLSALREFARILTQGGLLLLTAPFSLETHATVVRARVREDGTIDHLKPPSYHGDPVNENGVLCYHEFGWQLLDELRQVGFRRTAVVTCWAPGFGYLGSSQPFVIAWR